VIGDSTQTGMGTQSPLTTHESMAITLDYYAITGDVGAIFAEAQASYVTLSRASDENGLDLGHFKSNKVRVNPMALAFYNDPY
jgi:hypothetical protein